MSDQVEQVLGHGLIPPDYPAPSDVKQGVVYANGEMVGTLVAGVKRKVVF